MDDDSPLVVSGRSWPSLVSRTVVIAPDGRLPFDESQWRDALVVVQSGAVEVETMAGLRHRFRSGDVLWLTGLPLRWLHNPGSDPVVLNAVFRRATPHG